MEIDFTSTGFVLTLNPARLLTAWLRRRHGKP